MISTTIHIFAEGQTDSDFFGSIIKNLSESFGIETTIIVQHPQYDATSGVFERGGDSKLISFYRESGGWKGDDKTLKTEHELAKDQKIFKDSGIENFPDPRHAKKNKFDILCALYGESSFIFSIDGDSAERISEKTLRDRNHHPAGIFCEDDDRFSYCKEAILCWTNLSQDIDKIIWAIPVYCLESWFLALHASDSEQEKIEKIATKDVHRLLIERKHPSYTDENGSVTVDKIRLVADHGQKIIEHLDKVKKHCPSFARFIGDAQQKLESRCARHGN